MKRIAIGTLVALVASLSTLSQAMAKSPIIPDVALQGGGVLQGQLLDKSGKAKADATVVVAQKGEAVVVAMTDKQGRFSVSGMQGGVYQIESEHAQGIYRLWAPKTAPPAAKSAVLMIADESVVRGQGVSETYGPAIRGAVAGGLITGGTYWALDYNKSGS